MGRRTLLTGALGLATTAGISACTGGDDVTATGTTDPTTGPERFTYGDDPSHWADLHRPSDPGA